MKLRLSAAAAGWLVLLTCACTVTAGDSLGGGSVTAFATVEEGRQTLTRRDDFVRRLSPFDRSARLKTDRPVAESEYLEFVGRAVREWSDAEKATVSEAYRSLETPLRQLTLPFPRRVLLIKTSGEEEGGAAYTRGEAIVLPARVLANATGRLSFLLAHELFHVLSRRHPELRDRLAADLGFRRTRELTFPPTLRDRKITNPDAPRIEHAIRVTVDGRPSWAMPILFSRESTYEVARGGEFFTYLQFRLLLVELGGARLPRPQYDPAAPILVDPAQAEGFLEQVGRNTTYLIHPEEVLAEHFAHLLMGTPDLASPHLVEQMERALVDWRGSRPARD